MNTSLQIGQQLGSFEITSLLGKGGMGEVYRAHDSKLKRDVAIKILPEEFSRDPERVSRFQREAEALAALNHQNIAAIYDIQQSGMSRFLVLELVEGDTLADVLRKRGALPVDEALHIAKQICEALEAAHEKGITHRDLKPANIKFSSGGKVKVLDFGLAKVREAGGAGAALSNSPTLMSASVPGMILGTAAYMSPEQAKGQEADRTTDVWAFGCVLYEMLTGHPLFEGGTIGEILAEVFKAEPDWHRLPAETPGGIRRLLRRCLQKDRNLRLHDAADARIEIAEVQSGSQVEGDAVVTGASRGRERLAWISSLALVTLIAVVAIVWALRPVTPAPEMRLEITTPSTVDPVSIAISPDGQKIVFVATSEGQSRLWLRSLDSVSARLLAGTDGASFPFWSPDSRSVGFFGDGKLKRIDIDGGSPQILADAPSGRGGAWNRDGTIIFTPDSGNSAIFRISATGGTASPLTRTEAPKQTNHRFPQFLPDGRHFLYYVQGSPESRGIYMGELDGSQTRRLLDSDSAAAYASSGQLLFVRQGALFAQDFDSTRLELRGNPFSVAEHIALGAGAQGSAALSTSVAGPIAYRTALASGLRQFVWVDRSGKEISKVGDPHNAYSLSISPDGRRLALTQQVNQNFDTWLLDLGRSVLSRFTFDASVDNFGIWSSDGRTIVFSSNRKGGADLYRKPTIGAGSEELLLASTQDKQPTDWSPDGRFLLYRSLDPKTGYDIWALPMDGDRKPFPVVQTNFDERDAQFSPDEKWITYQSNESGRPEIYIQPFPGPGAKQQVSTNGGAQVRWRRDGKELFYIALDGRLMAVPIRASNAETIEAGTPISLFATHVGGALQPPFMQQYVVSPDGQRFLMNTVTDEATSPITVILNWKGKP